MPTGKNGKIRLRIYAAPRTATGDYWMQSDKTSFIMNFDSLEEREAFWNQHIVPHASVDPGAEYEYRMVDEDGTAWNFSSPPRYGSASLIQNMTRQRNDYIAEGNISQLIFLKADNRSL